jgi:hypothetical protein
VDVINQGNGPVDAMVIAEGLPEAWSSWIRVDGENITSSIPLSAPYDAENNATVEVWIHIPSEEAASEVHTIVLTVSNPLGLVDVQIDDNTISFDTITASVRIPALEGSTVPQSAMVGDMVSVNATLTNIGNAVDDDVIVIATFSSSPPNSDIVGFFTTSINGASKPVGEAVMLRLLPNQSTALTMDLLLPDSMVLNTRIVVSFEVVAGMNPEMLPYELSYDALIMVDQQRHIDASLSAPSTTTNPTGVGVPLFVNITSTSSQQEQIRILTLLPESWQMVCNGVLVDQQGQNLTFEVGHLTPQLSDIPCTLHRLGGPLEGKVTFDVATIDGERTWQDS